jgi:hypothetical protein
MSTFVALDVHDDARDTASSATSQAAMEAALLVTLSTGGRLSSTP